MRTYQSQRGGDEVKIIGGREGESEGTDLDIFSFLEGQKGEERGEVVELHLSRARIVDWGEDEERWRRK